MGTMHHEVMHGALHVLELPAPFEGVSRRQCNPGVNLAFQLRHVAAQIAPLHIDPHDDSTLAHGRRDRPFEGPRRPGLGKYDRVPVSEPS